MKPNGARPEKLMSKRFSGFNSSELFIKEIIDFCNGSHNGLKLDDIEAIFKPQWEYQNLTRSAPPIRDGKEVLQFLDQGINGMDYGK